VKIAYFDCFAGISGDMTLGALIGAGDGIVFRNCILEKNLQGFPGATAQIGKKLPIVEEVTVEDFRDAEYEMSVRNLLEDIHAEPLPEFHHPLLMTGWTKVAALARKCQQIFMAAVFAFHAGKAVVQITAVEMTIDHLLDIGPPEARTVVLFVKRDSFKNTQEKRT
jgi:hypothetical protein